jgi:hypothetical protein
MEFFSASSAYLCDLCVNRLFNRRVRTDTQRTAEKYSTFVQSPCMRLLYETVVERINK